jgi:UDP-N-acetylglucosamine transferase subunit ALG13
MMSSEVRSLREDSRAGSASILRHVGRRKKCVHPPPIPALESVRIFVTVGTELPFDRLVNAVDQWAFSEGRHHEVFAQIGPSTRPPAHIRWTRFVDGPQFRQLLCNADLTVAHAGMGTILSALQYQRPLIVMPRRASLREHRSEHQLATAARLSALGRVEMVQDEVELIARLGTDRHDSRSPIGQYADPSLLEAIRESIQPLR